MTPLTPQSSITDPPPDIQAYRPYPNLARAIRSQTDSIIDQWRGRTLFALPDLSDIISGKAQIDELRDVDVSDLLGRDPVNPNPQLFESCIRSKCVMVTGAGGSIGSELCRQILRSGPRRLVLFEMSELALYNIQRELEELRTREALTVEILPLLGNAHHRHY